MNKLHGCERKKGNNRAYLRWIFRPSSSPSTFVTFRVPNTVRPVIIFELRTFTRTRIVGVSMFGKKCRGRGGEMFSALNHVIILEVMNCCLLLVIRCDLSRRFAARRHR